jgi:hypothetical protein
VDGDRDPLRELLLDVGRRGVGAIRALSSTRSGSRSGITARLRIMPTESSSQTPAEDHERADRRYPHHLSEPGEEVAAAGEQEQNDPDQRKVDQDRELGPLRLLAIYLGAESHLAPELRPGLECPACPVPSSESEDQPTVLSRRHRWRRPDWRSRIRPPGKRRCPSRRGA